VVASTEAGNRHNRYSRSGRDRADRKLPGGEAATSSFGLRRLTLSRAMPMSSASRGHRVRAAREIGKRLANVQPAGGHVASKRRASS